MKLPKEKKYRLNYGYGATVSFDTMEEVNLFIKRRELKYFAIFTNN